MDIFNSNTKKQDLEKYKQVPLLLGVLENSTCSVEAYITGICFNEEELIEWLDCTGNIITIDCNYGHKFSEEWRANHPPKKKSSRGRKKKVKQRKIRKYQGDGSSFNSQITFGVVGTHIRRVPIINDTPKHDVEICRLSRDLESVTKIYKIKVFRNGKISIPGALTEDLSDIQSPLDEVCRYLQLWFLADVKPIAIFSTMRNYKCRLLNGKIDIAALQTFCSQHFQNLLNIKFSDVIDFLAKPVFDDHNYIMHSIPHYDGWNQSFMDIDNFSDVIIDTQALKRFLLESTQAKNLYVNFDELIYAIDRIEICEIYQQVYKFYQIIHNNFMVITDNNYDMIFQYLLVQHLKSCEELLNGNENNIFYMSRRDSEKYPGYILRLRCPDALKKDKLCTVKIFMSGKINIDSMNSRADAEFIYYWLNWIFYNNPELTYNDNYIVPEYDSEFSSDSE